MCVGVFCVCLLVVTARLLWRGLCLWIWCQVRSGCGYVSSCACLRWLLWQGCVLARDLPQPFGSIPARPIAGARSFAKAPHLSRFQSRHGRQHAGVPVGLVCALAHPLQVHVDGLVLPAGRPRRGTMRPEPGRNGEGGGREGGGRDGEGKRRGTFAVDFLTREPCAKLDEEMVLGLERNAKVSHSLHVGADVGDERLHRRCRIYSRMVVDASVHTKQSVQTIRERLSAGSQTAPMLLQHLSCKM